MQIFDFLVKKTANLRVGNVEPGFAKPIKNEEKFVVSLALFQQDLSFGAPVVLKQNFVLFGEVFVEVAQVWHILTQKFHLTIRLLQVRLQYNFLIIFGVDKDHFCVAFVGVGRMIPLCRLLTNPKKAILSVCLGRVVHTIVFALNCDAALHYKIEVPTRVTLLVEHLAKLHLFELQVDGELGEHGRRKFVEKSKGKLLVFLLHILLDYLGGLNLRLHRTVE